MVNNELCDYELKVLRHAAGEEEQDVIYGAALMSAVTFLKNAGYLARKMTEKGFVYALTDKGRTYLAAATGAPNPHVVG